MVDLPISAEVDGIQSALGDSGQLPTDASLWKMMLINPLHHQPRNKNHHGTQSHSTIALFTHPLACHYLSPPAGLQMGHTNQHRNVIDDIVMHGHRSGDIPQPILMRIDPMCSDTWPMILP